MPPHAHVRIHIQPTPALLDTKLTVRVTGLPSAGAVTVRGGSVDGSGRAWRSEAHVVADTAGVVDLARDPAGPGSTYAGVDPMGLIWSMTRAPERDTTAVRDPLDAVPLDVEALVDGHPVATARVERLALPPDVERTDVRCGAFPGVLFTCAEAGPRPGVVALGGAEGGVHEADAALLAGHGYATLALAYFDPMAGRWLDRVPVEEFGAALDLLAAHPSVRGDRLGVIGGSFGGATALLVGSHFPAVRAVVSVVGSGVLTQGIEAAPGFLQIMAADTAPYTWRGEPLPFVPNTVTEDVRRLVEAGQPIELGATFLPGLADLDRVAAATIGVERIQGPVLLISAGQDAGWPSEQLSAVAMRRLTDHHHPYEHRHLHVPEAGHAVVAPPYTPTTELLSEGPGVLFRDRGTPAANAHGREQAWTETLSFLDRSLVC